MGNLTEKIRGLMAPSNPPVTQAPKIDQNASDSYISELNKKVDSLHKLAFNDELTGLPNRRSFQRELECNINLSQQFNIKLAVVFLDMDRFKYINDRFGHDAGDALLREVAGRMLSVLQPPNFAARLGGDEFTVLLPSISDEKEAEQVGFQLLSSLQQRYLLEVNGSQLEIDSTPSIGISIYPTDGITAKELMKAADLAMYSIKQNGKNNVGFFKEIL